MSSEANRSAENLLLLCIPHSHEVDEDETRSPAEMRGEWRIAQQQGCLDLLQSWTIRDAQAEEVARESSDSPAVSAPVLTVLVRHEPADDDGMTRGL